MTREACKAELARTVAVLGNLRYVDLPEGLFQGQTSCNALKQELQASCPDIRRMKYTNGSERSFVNLSHHHIWQNMEILELAGIHVDPQDLLYVLASFSFLQELKLIDLPWLDDSIFTGTGLPAFFPAVHRLTLSSTPNVHAEGLAAYLTQPCNHEVLRQLNLSTTGIQPENLHQFLAKATCLEQLSISEDIGHSIRSAQDLPMLSSSSLKTLHYEITSHSSPRHNLHSPATSYSNYLASSLLSNSLPRLVELFVLDPSFPELLLFPLQSRLSQLPSSSSNFSPPSSPISAPPPGLSQPLSVYTKGQEDLEWSLISITSPSPKITSRKSNSRPISVMGAGTLSPVWGGEARKSVMVGNGLGGFLAVPEEETPKRPMSLASSIPEAGREWAIMTGNVFPDRSKKERKDLWR